jgi:hypothetical protein
MKTFLTVSICVLLALAVLLLAFPRTAIAQFLTAYLAHPLDPRPVSFDWQQRAGVLAAAAACILLLHRWQERQAN